jgi:7,8-dihydropterin-6-yl-methyl-4-(beta-D-ribofuranosyl)aminobenzene 5'-phosphate synthase
MRSGPEKLINRRRSIPSPARAAGSARGSARPGPVAFEPVVNGQWFTSTTRTGPMVRQTGEDTGGDFYLDPACTQPDPIRDDQAAYIPCDAGTVVILGCTHAGLINTLLHIRDLTDSRPIAAVIGGLHLLNADEHRMGTIRGALQDLGIGRIVPTHCTGFHAAAELYRAFQGRFTSAEMGTVLEL